MMQRIVLFFDRVLHFLKRHNSACQIAVWTYFGIRQQVEGWQIEAVTRIPCSFSLLRHARQPHQIALVNKTGLGPQ